MKTITDGSENMIYYIILWSCLQGHFLNHLSLSVTVQLPERLWHPSIENRFAMAGCPQAVCIHTVCAALIPSNIRPEDTFIHQLYLKHGIKEVSPNELEYAFSEFFKNQSIFQTIRESGSFVIKNGIKRQLHVGSFEPNEGIAVFVFSKKIFFVKLA